MFLFCMLDILLAKFYFMLQFIVASNCPMFPSIYIYIYREKYTLPTCGLVHLQIAYPWFRN
jgi:hypothetical protein